VGQSIIAFSGQTQYVNLAGRQLHLGAGTDQPSFWITAQEQLHHVIQTRNINCRGYLWNWVNTHVNSKYKGNRYANRKAIKYGHKNNNAQC
jgi:hypothetical protein